MIQNLTFKSYNYPIVLAWLVLVVYFLMPANSFAQEDYSNTKISELFKNPKKIQWVKHYKGRVDDINEVGLMIAYDGKSCKGFITYLRSKERFKLEGDIIGQKIILRETDSEESVTGHFEGNIKKDFSAIQAHWFNREKTRAGLLKLQLTEREVVFPGYCGDNKWVRKYTGYVQDEQVQLLIQRNSEYHIVGTIWFVKKNRSYCLKGAMTSESKLKVKVLDDLENIIGVIDGQVHSSNSRITGNWIDAKEEESKVGFSKIDDITVGCIEYQDYMTTYDVTFPKSKNAAFNEYIDKTVNNWKQSCQDRVKSLKIDNPYPGPDERSLANAAGWFEMGYLSDTIISGYITFNKSWEDEHKDIAFNYDLIKGKSFTLYDLFKIGVDYESILREKALTKIRFTSLYGNTLFKEWIEDEQFQLFTIRDNGIRFSTAFHPIFGRQSVTIPFSELEEYLNPYSPVSHLYAERQKKRKKKRMNK